MKRFFLKPRTVGYAPGSLIPNEEPDQHPLKLTLFEYGPEMSAVEQQIQQLSDCFPFKTQTAVNWLNINGSHKVELLEDIGRRLEIHPLVLEDILNTSQRPKLEDYDQYLYL